MIRLVDNRAAGGPFVPRCLRALTLLLATTALPSLSAGQDAPVSDTASSTVVSTNPLASIAVLTAVDTAIVAERRQLSPAFRCGLYQAVQSALQQGGVFARDPAIFNSGDLLVDDPGCSRETASDDALRRAAYELDLTLSVELHDVTTTPPRGARCSGEVTATWQLQGWADSQGLITWRDQAEGETFCATPDDGVFRAMRNGTIAFLERPGVLDQLNSAAGSAAERRAVRDSLRTEEELATWGRPAPPPTAQLIIRPDETNHATQGSVVGRAQGAIVTLFASDGLGSAFILTRDGLAITNRHVVEGSSSEAVLPLRARFADGAEVPARLLRVAPNLDAALVQVFCQTPCQTLPLDVIDEPALGDDVYLIGSPRGLPQSVSRGILSSIRFVEGATYFQTDAAANPGNSGGPMLHSGTGMVVGVLTFGIRESEGLNFAIAIQDVLRSLGVRIRP